MSSSGTGDPWSTRLRAPRGDDGFTLVELLVSIILFGVVSAVASAAVITATQTQRNTDALVTGQTEASKVVERVSRDVRTANPLRAAAANDLTLDTLRGSTCERRRYYLDAQNSLQLAVTPFASGTKCGTTASPGLSTTTTPIADEIASGTTLFQYFKWDTTTGQRVAVAAPVAASGLVTVDAVVITATVPAGQRQPVTVSTQVDLRNVEIQ